MGKLDPNRLCPQCLNEKPGQGGKCPHCGYEPGMEEVSPRCMPPFTILAGRYLVGTVLGEGGFGITYRGWDLEKERKIAIKEYFPAGLVTRDTSRGGDNTVQSISGQMRTHYQEGLEKYENEAKCLMELKGTPGIVDILSFFRENATAYIIMEFIEGMTLKNYLTVNQGCLAERQVLDLFRPLLCSLDSIHQLGIVHRDISPDNIIVQPNGELKLIDFGAARQSTGQATQSLTVILKHGYAPEEQYRSRSKQGPFTDVYAISATLYKVLTGVTPVDSMSRMFEDELRPLEDFPHHISPQVCAAVARGMAVRAENRFQTVSQLIEALYEGTFAEDRTVAMPISKRKHTKKMLAWIAAGAAACGLVLLAISRLVSPGAGTGQMILMETLPDMTGRTEAEARAAAEEKGMYVSVEYAPADGAHAGLVLSSERTSDQSVTLVVGELTAFTFEETEEGIKLTGTGEMSEFLKLPDTINGIPVVTIGAYAFAEEVEEETYLYGVEFPKQLKSIEEGAFSGCICLEKVQLPDTVERIGDGAFWGCSAMSELYLSAELYSIGDFAFQHNISLTDIILPEGCEQVGTQSFEGCLNAGKVEIPASVTQIGDGAFTGCRDAQLYVVSGSYGETYAKAGNVPYVVQ